MRRCLAKTIVAEMLDLPAKRSLINLSFLTIGLFDFECISGTRKQSQNWGSICVSYGDLKN